MTVWPVADGSHRGRVGRDAIEGVAQAVALTGAVARADLTLRITRAPAAHARRADAHAAVSVGGAIAPELALTIHTLALGRAQLTGSTIGATAAAAAVRRGDTAIGGALAGDRTCGTRCPQRIAPALHEITAVAALRRALALHAALTRASARILRSAAGLTAADARSAAGGRLAIP